MSLIVFYKTNIFLCVNSFRHIDSLMQMDGFHPIIAASSLVEVVL